MEAYAAQENDKSPMVHDCDAPARSFRCVLSCTARFCEPGRCGFPASLLQVEWETSVHEESSFLGRFSSTKSASDHRPHLGEMPSFSLFSNHGTQQ
jgi:hypothetical protein